VGEEVDGAEAVRDAEGSVSGKEPIIVAVRRDEALYIGLSMAVLFDFTRFVSRGRISSRRGGDSVRADWTGIGRRRRTMERVGAS